MEYILSTDRLTKQFKQHKAVDQVSLHVKRGQIYGFIGRNGAGKTTFLKMISGLSSPTDGTFTLFGYSGFRNREMFARIGSLIEEPGLYPNMSAYDNLRLKCISSGVRKKGYIEEILRIVGLEEVGSKHIRKYSLGMKQRLGIGMALIGEPDLLVLDEPINGLDPQGIAEVRDTILKLNQEHNITIIISSHILEELAKIATNYGIIHEGRLIQELTRAELLERCSEHMEILLDQPEKGCTVLERLGFRKYKVTDQDKIHVFERLNETAQITMALAQEGIPVRGISVNAEELETYFLQLTGGGADA